MSSKSFPLADPLTVSHNHELSSETIIEGLGPFLTAERKERIEKVVSQRTYSVAVVLENIYDRGNASAVMRTAEALGFPNIHMIETSEQFKAANRVTQGADKWLDINIWQSSKDAIRAIKAQGFQLCVTTLEASKPLDEVDFSKPSAIVLGNERDGVSQEMLEAADEKVLIPMNGFVQSFNISVAGALSLYHILQDRKAKLGQSGDLTAEEKRILTASYYLRSSPKAAEILR